MKLNLSVLASSMVALLAISPISQAHEGKTISGFKMPESAYVSDDGRVFVSEIGEFNKDGDGQISVVETDGSVRVFAKGMDDPKGLAMIGSDLYVADKTRVLKIAVDGSWKVFADASAFPKTPQFLNDLESDDDGTLYVSDSGDLSKGGAIYSINKEGKVAVVVSSDKDKRVLAPNGLLMGGYANTLLEVDFASGILYMIDLETHKMQQVADELGGGDGVVRGPKGQIYISDWKNGKVFSYYKDVVVMLKSGFQSAADIAITNDGKYLLVPDMKAGELVYLPLH